MSGTSAPFKLQPSRCRCRARRTDLGDTNNGENDQTFDCRHQWTS